MQAKTLVRIKTFSAKQGIWTGGYIESGVTFSYVEQSGVWLKLANNNWVSGGSDWQYIRLIPDTTTPPPSTTPTISIDVEIDGQMWYISKAPLVKR